MSAFDKIMAGLEDAKAHLEGHPPAGARVHTIHVPEPDVVAIRKQSGLSQGAFATSIGVSVRTVQNWEQGRRRPEGPARVLLALLDKDPMLVSKTLSASR